MARTAAALGLALLWLTCAALGDTTLAPLQFLKDNADAFSIMLEAYKRLPYDSVFQEALNDPQAGATFIIPFDAGFEQASNRTVDELLNDIDNSSPDALQWWMGQWLIPQQLASTDALLQAGSAETINGQILHFTRTPGRFGVVVSMDGEQLGAGGLVGPAAIRMGNVVVYMMGPLSN